MFMMWNKKTLKVCRHSQVNTNFIVQLQSIGDEILEQYSSHINPLLFL